MGLYIQQHLKNVYILGYEHVRWEYRCHTIIFRTNEKEVTNGCNLETQKYYVAELVYSVENKAYISQKFNEYCIGINSMAGW